MRASSIVVYALVAVLMASCGSPEFNAFTTGVRREDAVEIGRAIRAQLHVKDVYSYSRADDGSITVGADESFYSATRAHGHWTFKKMVVLLHPAI